MKTHFYLIPLLGVFLTGCGPKPAALAPPHPTPTPTASPTPSATPAMSPEPTGTPAMMGLPSPIATPVRSDMVLPVEVPSPSPTITPTPTPAGFPDMSISPMETPPNRDRTLIAPKPGSGADSAPPKILGGPTPS